MKTVHYEKNQNIRKLNSYLFHLTATPATSSTPSTVSYNVAVCLQDCQPYRTETLDTCCYRSLPAGMRNISYGKKCSYCGHDIFMCTYLIQHTQKYVSGLYKGFNVIYNLRHITLFSTIVFFFEKVISLFQLHIHVNQRPCWCDTNRNRQISWIPKPNLTQTRPVVSGIKHANFQKKFPHYESFSFTLCINI